MNNGSINIIEGLPAAFTAHSPDEMFAFGEKIGGLLAGGEVLLLTGGLGAGKTLLTKGILNALEFDVDEVTSPSFTLVNMYETDRFAVYHIDLWRLDESSDAALGVGLHEILEDENAVVVIEWAERLGDFRLDGRGVRLLIEGDGEQAREITIKAS